MTTALLPCFKCGKKLDSALPGRPQDNQPYAGTAFYSPGHYGSTFFDPMDGQQIEITICDDCLSKNQGAIAWQRANILLTCAGIAVGRKKLQSTLEFYIGQDEAGDVASIKVEPIQFGSPEPGIVWFTSQFEVAKRAWAADHDEPGPEKFTYENGHAWIPTDHGDDS